jgi:uncharacterized membrane protein YccF (DUF307 family)
MAISYTSCRTCIDRAVLTRIVCGSYANKHNGVMGGGLSCLGGVWVVLGGVWVKVSHLKVVCLHMGSMLSYR